MKRAEHDHHGRAATEHHPAIPPGPDGCPICSLHDHTPTGRHADDCRRCHTPPGRRPDPTPEHTP